MKTNPLYRGLLDKSVASMLSAIEIYNKPDFQYREETFAILAINAWELLFKAYILRKNKYRKRSIYDLEPAILKDGTRSKSKKVIAYNRSGNPKTISIFTAIKILDTELHKNLRENVEALIELRDNAVHFYNITPIAITIQKYGFACIKNYIGIIKVWNLPIDIKKYNLYLMPLAYVDNQVFVDSTLTNEQSKYLKLLEEGLKHKEDDEDFDIAISIKLEFKKEKSTDAIGMKYSPDGIAVSISEEERKRIYPYTYKQIMQKCKERYSDYKCNKIFYEYIKEIKANKKLAYNRDLYPNNPKSLKVTWYSPNVMSFLDTKYTKK